MDALSVVCRLHVKMGGPNPTFPYPPIREEELTNNCLYVSHHQAGRVVIFPCSMSSSPSCLNMSGIHNLKGYDGMLLLRYFYAQHREVTGMVTVGAKVLSFSSDRLTFKDSLCFLPFPLASFPATFGLTELCKGFFPHLFNTSANQSYVGPIPEARYYDPDGMSSKKREEFLRWHATKVAEDYEFDLKRDMTRYCESDVKLLKAGCVKFVKEFRGPAQFDPMEKCLTIASACNRYWRKVHLIPKSVAVQPFNGWKGTQPRQSMQARQWLSYKNFLLRSDDTETTTSFVTLSTEGKYASEACLSMVSTRRDAWCTNITVVFTAVVFLAFPINGSRRRVDDAAIVRFKNASRRLRSRSNDWKPTGGWWKSCGSANG